MDEQPMSYLLFKLNKEMNYQDTFEKDEKVKKEYNEYLKGIEGRNSSEQVKKKAGKISPLLKISYS
tara:strand:+ start:580 stop:777 length:198 start_codon:yes stop_codon:yes gene_type:complete